MAAPTWILPGRVAAGQRPGRFGARAATLAWLEREGVRRLIWLSQATPDLPAEYAVIWLPVPDFAVPDPDLLRAALDLLQAGGPPIYVCCDMGQGRTGTVVACLLIETGLAPEEALARTRRLLPGAVETPDQEAAVLGSSPGYSREPLRDGEDA